MSAHAPLSPSGADRWMNCPGSVEATRGLPEEAPGEAAVEGNRLHKIAERALIYALGTTGGAPLAVAPEDAAIIEPYVNAVRDAAGGDSVLVEHRVGCGGAHRSVWGTVDAAIFRPYGRSVIIDLKTGRKHVPADCLQLRLYALEGLSEDSGDVETIIVQPQSHEPVRRHVYTHGELVVFREEVSAKAAAALTLGAPRRAGEHCTWCRARATCPEARAEVESRALVSFAPAAVVAPPDPASLSVGTLSRVLDAADMVSAWFDAVQAHAKRVMEAGVEVPGYALGKGRAGNRKWVSEEAAVDLAAHLGLDITGTTVLSPTQVEKVLGKDALASLSTEIVRSDPQTIVIKKGP